uniref:Retrotransposon gag domain-containing protein n=1 Tax=Trichogramma kaykai TaxID=54128 RepID=A0ABD2XQA3_9HYME
MDMETCLDWLLNHANVSCILGQYAIVLLTARHSDLMKQAKPCFWSAYRAFAMRRGSPHTPSFNRIIRATQESGIVQSWWQKFDRDVEKLHNKRNNVNEASELIEKHNLTDRFNDYGGG